jgi:hypothetical protein
MVTSLGLTWVPLKFGGSSACRTWLILRAVTFLLDGVVGADAGELPTGVDFSAGVDSVLGVSRGNSLPAALPLVFVRVLACPDGSLVLLEHVSCLFSM